MTKTEFLKQLEIYGSELKRWPEDKRVLAKAFLDSTDVDLQKRIADEASLDAFMSTANSLPEIDAELEAKLIDLVPVQSSNSQSIFQRLSQSQPRKWLSAGLISISLLGGVSVGYAQATDEIELAAVEGMLGFVSLDEDSELSPTDWLE